MGSKDLNYPSGMSRPQTGHNPNRLMEQLDILNNLEVAQDEFDSFLNSKWQGKSDYQH